jgi:ADP-ribosylglycohydrolase
MDREEMVNNCMQMKDDIKGFVFGQAIRDALGLATEFMIKEDIGFRYPNGIRNYQDTISDRHRSRWKKGEWADDTEQTICVFDNLLKKTDLLMSKIYK